MNPIIAREDFRLLQLLECYPALQSELRHATVVSESELPPDVVTMNSSVAYEDVTAHVRHTVKLVYPHAAGGADRLPVTTPLGLALLGAREGQELECNFPLGERHRLRVETVLSQAQRPGMTRDEKPDEESSDAFVVPWEPRALDADQAG
jgi:regulator of nucleoside diphosphate kinase